MPEGVETKWYLDEVKVSIGDGTSEAVEQLVFLIEATAKGHITGNGQVDTGFMRSAVYAAIEREDHRPAAEADAKGRADRVMVPADVRPGQDKIVGIIHCAADYAIYQELRDPFLYSAAEIAAEKFDGFVEKVFKPLLED
jgi:hypothetical protein